MNSILLVVVGLVLLTAELIPAAPAPFFEDEDADMVDPDLDFQDLAPVKRSKAAHTRCIMQCLICSDYTSMRMADCTTGCYGTSNPSQTRAYNACNKYLHSGRK